MYEKEFKTLYKFQAQWMRLQGKEVLYNVDVELDQIVTYFRVSLANLCSYFLKQFLDMRPTQFSSFMHTTLLLDGQVEETEKIRKITLKQNHKDPLMMEKLKLALIKFNSLSLRTLSGKTYQFCIS